LVFYVTDEDRCPAILVVEEAPIWEPGEVDREWPREGDRWGVVTKVRCEVAAKDGGPSLGHIGVPAASINSHGHIWLQRWQFENALAAIRGRPIEPRRPRVSKQRVIPVEELHAEGYEYQPDAEIKKALRRESRLVTDYVAALRAKGDEVSALALELAFGGTLRCDVYNRSRGQLVEAKVTATRPAVRMAIGQLADYARFVRPEPIKAILLEARPSADLVDLLASQSIGVIWRDGDGFADDASGLFI
jgi:hypothetical protein